MFWGDIVNINILIVISCICMLFIIGKIFIIPIKKILKLVFNSIFGGGLIWFINLIGGIWGFHIGLNIFTSVLVRHFRCSWCYNFGYCKADFNVKNGPGTKLSKMKKCTRSIIFK